MKTLTKKQIEFLNKHTKGSWSYDPATGLVDVEGDFDCSSKRLWTLSVVKFGKVSGYFNCSYNRLTTLEGAPQEVGGGFYCENNQLTTLEGAPQKVGGNFSERLLFGGNFECYCNNLTSLVGAPQEVGGNFRYEFHINKGKWNINGWIQALKQGYTIILTLPYLSEDDKRLYELGLL